MVEISPIIVTTTQPSGMPMIEIAASSKAILRTNPSLRIRVSSIEFQVSSLKFKFGFELRQRGYEAVEHSADLFWQCSANRRIALVGRSS